MFSNTNNGFYLRLFKHDIDSSGWLDNTWRTLSRAIQVLLSRSATASLSTFSEFDCNELYGAENLYKR